MSVTFCVQLPPEATVAKLALRRGGVYCFRAAPPAPARHPMAGQLLVDVVTDPTVETFFGIIASGPVTVRRGKPAAVSLYSEVNVTGADCDLLHTGNALAPYVTDRKLVHFTTIDKYVWGVVPEKRGSTRSDHAIPPGYTINVLGLTKVAIANPVAAVEPAPESPQQGVRDPATTIDAAAGPASSAQQSPPDRLFVQVLTERIQTGLSRIGAIEQEDSVDNITAAIETAIGSSSDQQTHARATTEIINAIDKTKVEFDGQSRGGKKTVEWKIDNAGLPERTATVDVQVKGSKGNRSFKTKQEFLPFVTDFIEQCGLFDGTSSGEIIVTVADAK